MTPPVIPVQDKPADDLGRLRSAMSRCAEMVDKGVFDAVNALVTMKRTAGELENWGNLYLSKVNLTPGRINVLMALNAAENHTLALSELGEYLVVTRPNITGLVDGLVADGLVRRVDHPADRRMVLAQLTPAGNRFMAWFVPEHCRNVQRLMSCFDAQELARFVTLLDKLRNHLRILEIPELAGPVLR